MGQVPSHGPVKRLPSLRLRIREPTQGLRTRLIKIGGGYRGSYLSEITGAHSLQSTWI